MPIATEEKINHYETEGYWTGETLDSFLNDNLNSAPQQLALIDPLNRFELVPGSPMRLTYAQLNQNANDMAAALYAQGLRKGDVVLVQMPNVAELVLIYLAAGRLGLQISPIAMQYGRFEIEHIAATIKPTAYLKFSSFKSKPYGEDLKDVLGNGCKILTIDENLPWKACTKFEIAAYEGYLEGTQQSPNDIFTICWTSGTTGRSKGVPRSQNHWSAIMYACTDAVPLERGEVILAPFPFINMAAIGGFLYFWLKQGLTLVLHHPFDPMIFLKQIQTEKVVYTIAPPPVLLHMIAQSEQIKAGFDLSSLKQLASGSAPLSVTMVKGISDHYGIEVVNLFGSNEGVALVSGPQDVPNPVLRAQFFPRFGVKGFPWSNRVSDQCQTKLMSLETGEEITDKGVAGELLIKGPTVFEGYYDAPEDNAKAFTEDGFFRSGDLFEIEGLSNEFYRFVGRSKNVIIRGGMNISPEELDDILLHHEQIMEVAVVGYKDVVYGEKVAAAVVVKPGCELDLEAVKNYLQERGVAKFKWPEKLVVFDALPRNPMNKIVRSEILDRL